MRGSYIGPIRAPTKQRDRAALRRTAPLDFTRQLCHETAPHEEPMTQIALQNILIAAAPPNSRPDALLHGRVVRRSLSAMKAIKKPQPRKLGLHQ
jgi:hypothetical protein